LAFFAFNISSVTAGLAALTGSLTADELEGGGGGGGGANEVADLPAPVDMMDGLSLDT